MTINSLTTDKPVALRFQIEFEFGNVGICGGRKPGEPGEKPSEQGREPTTNSTHIWRRVRESNPGHIGGTGKCSHHCAIPAPLNDNDIQWLLNLFN